MISSEELSSNLTAEQKARVSEAINLRGKIIGAYSHIEFLLADLCIRAWGLPEYSHHAGPFPYKIETRIARFKELFAHGPLQKFAPEVAALVPALLNYEEQRHFMAHGLMSVQPYSERDWGVELRLFRPTKNGADLAVLQWPIEGFRSEGEDIAEYCNRWLQLLFRIHHNMGWVVTNAPTTP
jgi:hypothetical protein